MIFSRFVGETFCANEEFCQERVPLICFALDIVAKQCLFRNNADSYLFNSFKFIEKQRKIVCTTKNGKIITEITMQCCIDMSLNNAFDVESICMT